MRRLQGGSTFPIETAIGGAARTAGQHHCRRRPGRPATTAPRTAVPYRVVTVVVVTVGCGQVFGSSNRNCGPCRGGRPSAPTTRGGSGKHSTRSLRSRPASRTGRSASRDSQLVHVVAGVEDDQDLWVAVAAPPGSGLAGEHVVDLAGRDGGLVVGAQTDRVQQRGPAGPARRPPSTASPGSSGPAPCPDRAGGRTADPGSSPRPAAATGSRRRPARSGRPPHASAPTGSGTRTDPPGGATARPVTQASWLTRHGRRHSVESLWTNL